MKKNISKLLFTLVILCITLGSCNKKDSEPDYASKVSGTWKVSMLNINGTVYNLPQNGFSSKITVSKVSNIKAAFYLDMDNNGNKGTEFLGNFDLRDGGSGSVEIYEKGKKIGFATTATLAISSIDSAGDSYSISASK